MWPGDTPYMGIFALELLFLRLGAADLKLPSWSILNFPVHASDNPKENTWVETGKAGGHTASSSSFTPCPSSHSQFHGQHPCSPHRLPHSAPHPSCITQVSLTNDGMGIHLRGVLSWNTSACLQLLAGSQSPVPGRHRENSFSALTTREQ